jgi:exonuclease III
MRLATFNIESLDLAPGLDARFAALRPMLERMAADILCLQEVNGQHVAGAPERRLVALEKLIDGTRYATYERAATSGPSGRGVASVHNLVTFALQHGSLKLIATMTATLIALLDRQESS